MINIHRTRNTLSANSPHVSVARADDRYDLHDGDDLADSRHHGKACAPTSINTCVVKADDNRVHSRGRQTRKISKIHREMEIRAF